MKVLIKQVRILSSSTPYNGTIQDILISDGIIQAISTNIAAAADEIISAEGLHCSIGWMDVFAHFNDPGYEHNETILTGAAAAAAGGFTDVMLVPNTNPVVHSKSQVEYIAQKSANLGVNIHPIGAITKNAEGKELAEMYDMYNSGAISFSDGNRAVQSPGILLKALQYVLRLNIPLIQLPSDSSISAHGLMNEGIHSTRLGLPGIPAIAEELMIARDLGLLRYTGSKLHFTGVSTAKGLALIAAAKEEGLQVSCSVTPYHGWFCDEDLAAYDTNLKVSPPLRSHSDMLAVREAISNGTADCIASHHFPQHRDDKVCEFEYAKNGMIGLESLFGAVNSAVTDIGRLINQLTIAPRRIFSLPVPEIREGGVACLTLFDPAASYTFTADMIRSASTNSAFTGSKLKGKVIGIINNNKIQLNTK